jgi:Spy/CpxP family protein refolding chaperone
MFKGGTQMKKILAFIMAAMVVFSFAAVPASAQTDDSALRFGEDGKFRILQLADIQDSAFLEYATLQFITDVVAECMANGTFLKNPSLDAIFQTNEEAYRQAAEIIKRIAKS